LTSLEDLKDKLDLYLFPNHSHNSKINQRNIMNEIQFRRKLAKSLREELFRGELKDKYTIKEGKAN